LPPLFFLALLSVLNPLLRSVLPGHLHQSRNKNRPLPSEVIAQSSWRATAGMSGWVQTYGTTAKNKNTAKITK
jgi:hypothetical protein